MFHLRVIALPPKRKKKICYQLGLSFTSPCSKIICPTQQPKQQKDHVPTRLIRKPTTEFPLLNYSIRFSFLYFRIKLTTICAQAMSLPCKLRLTWFLFFLNLSKYNTFPFPLVSIIFRSQFKLKQIYLKACLNYFVFGFSWEGAFGPGFKSIISLEFRTHWSWVGKFIRGSR